MCTFFWLLFSECIWHCDFGEHSDLLERIDKESLEAGQRKACIKILDFLANKAEIGATNVELEVRTNY